MNIIITGASKGLGKAVAAQFASAKNSLFICSRNNRELLIVKKEFLQKYPACSVEIMAVDLSIKKNVLQFADWCLQFGVPDIVVNNAGEFIGGNVYNEEDGTLEKMIEINLYSAYYLTRKLLSEMMKAKRGHVFNMCSIASLKAYENGGAYSISKFALAGFSKNLREEMKPYNIKVTAVYPGAAMSDSWRGAGINPKRIMEAEDVAKMIFAASQLSPQACVEDIILRPQLGDL
ncbi:MAG: SDR family oxidoreductase [Chitinophagaceae bacterium]